MCKNWREKGSCRYGDKCLFAHVDHELSRRQSTEDYAQNSPVKKDASDLKPANDPEANIENVLSQAEADKENKKEDITSEESARSKIAYEEIKVLESMENMDNSELAARKAPSTTTEEVTCPSIEAQIGTHSQLFTPDKKKKKSKEPQASSAVHAVQHITPNKGGSASKRLKIFEDITSPGEVTKASQATAGRGGGGGQGSAKVQNIDSTGISYE
jgi:hypothetical protein